jgi:hypothetical protein
MYFSSRTDKTKIIQLQNQIESLQSTINNAKVSPSNSDLEKKVDELLKENKSLKEQIELLQSQKTNSSQELVELEEVKEESVEVVEEEQTQTNKTNKQSAKLNSKKQKDSTKNEL